MTDPWAFQRWAFSVHTGNSAKKALLLALAAMADNSTGRCEAKQETLAQWVEGSERSIRANLVALEKAALIARRHQYRQDGKRRSDEFLLRAPWIETWPDGGLLSAQAPKPTTGKKRQSTTGKNRQRTTGKNRHLLPAENDKTPAKDDKSEAQTPDHYRQESTSHYRQESTNHYRQKTTGQELLALTENGHSSSLRSSERLQRAQADVPAEFPDELRPHARTVMRVLVDLAKHRPGAKAVKALAVANLIMARQYKPLVRAVYDYASWSEGQPAGRRHKDMVTGYRNWLDRCEDLAAIEALGADGRPPPGVASSGRALSPRERKMEADELQNARLRQAVMNRRKSG